MVTSTVKRVSAKKAGSKASVKPVKAPAPKAAAKKAPAPKAAAKKAAAKKAAAPKAAAPKAAAKKAVGGSRKRNFGVPGKPIFFDGQPAHNRHFEVSVENESAAREVAAEQGHSLAEVMRAGLSAYGAKMPIAATRGDGKTSMPAAGVRGLQEVYKSGRSDLISGYMAALAGEGWPLQVIADCAVEHGLAGRMSRQAVSLRVNKALKVDGGLPDGLPDVPPIGLRRPYPTVQAGGGTKALAETKGGRLRDDLKDVTVRIADEDYARVQMRAKFEGAKVAAVLDDILGRYASGAFKMKPVKKAAG